MRPSCSSGCVHQSFVELEIGTSCSKTDSFSAAFAYRELNSARFTLVKSAGTTSMGNIFGACVRIVSPSAPQSGVSKIYAPDTIPDASLSRRVIESGRMYTVPRLSHPDFRSLRGLSEKTGAIPYLQTPAFGILSKSSGNRHHFCAFKSLIAQFKVTVGSRKCRSKFRRTVLSDAVSLFCAAISRRYSEASARYKLVPV